MITADLNKPLMVGETATTLICDVSGAERLNQITYQWTRDSGTTWTSGRISKSFTLSPLQLTHAGSYLCRMTSVLLNNPVTANNTQRVIIQSEYSFCNGIPYIFKLSIPFLVPDPQSVVVTSNIGNIVPSGSNVILNCSVQMNSSVTDSEVLLLTVDAQLIQPNGAMLSLANPIISGTIFTFSTEVNSFGINDVGNYTCSATIRPRPSSPYLTESNELSGRIELRISEKKICGFFSMIIITILLLGISLTTDNSGNVYSSTYKIPSTTGNDGDAYSTTYGVTSTTGNNNGNACNNILLYYIIIVMNL